MMQGYDSQPQRNPSVAGSMPPQSAGPSAPVTSQAPQGGGGAGAGLQKQEHNCDTAASKNSGPGGMSSPVKGFTSTSYK
jgi:hypothetical protein